MHFHLKNSSGLDIPHTAHRIEYNEYGPPSVLEYVESKVPSPGQDQVLVKNYAIGINNEDFEHRAGDIKTSKFPHCGMGNEGAGVVVKVGPASGGFKVGDRVVYCMTAGGSYADYAIAMARATFLLPDKISFEVAAASLVKGMTAEYLLCRSYPLKEGDTCLLQNGAEGVGPIAIQLATVLGAKIIATDSTDAKCALAKHYGAWGTINYRKEDVASRMLDLTHGKKVPVVYDSIGEATWESSLNCADHLGTVVSFGEMSGPVPPVQLNDLMQKGHLYVTRPSLQAFSRKFPEMAEQLFNLIVSGRIEIPVNQTYPLSQAAKAQEDIADHKTTGSSILIPDELVGSSS